MIVHEAEIMEQTHPGGAFRVHMEVRGQGISHHGHPDAVIIGIGAAVAGYLLQQEIPGIPGDFLVPLGKANRFIG